MTFYFRTRYFYFAKYEEFYIFYTPHKGYISKTLLGLFIGRRMPIEQEFFRNGSKG